MRSGFILTMSIENATRPNVSEIMETVELGQFETIEEARSAYEDLLEVAGFDEAEDESEDE